MPHPSPTEMFNKAYNHEMEQNGMIVNEIKVHYDEFIKQISQFVDRPWFGRKMKITLHFLNWADVEFKYMGVNFVAGFNLTEKEGGYRILKCSLAKKLYDVTMDSWSFEQKTSHCDPCRDMIECTITHFAKMKANRDFKAQENT